MAFRRNFTTVQFAAQTRSFVRLRSTAAAAAVAVAVLAGALFAPGVPGGGRSFLGVPDADASVVSARVSRTYFSPNGDGVFDTVTLTWTGSGALVHVLVEVRRADQTTGQPALRTLDLGSRTAGADSAIWDGRDDGGTVVPDAQYLLRVVERDASNALVSESVASTTLDVTPPADPRFEGLGGPDVTSPDFALTGYAPFADSLSILQNGSLLLRIPIAAPDSAFVRLVDLVEGANDFALQSTDRAGNRSNLTAAVTITYRNTADVILPRALPTTFSPNGDGILDSTRIVFDIDAATTRLEVQVRRAQPPSGTTLADTAAYVRLYDAPASAGGHDFIWQGNDSTGLAAPEASYFFFVRAESSTVAGQPAPGTPHTVRVVLDRTPPVSPVPSPLPPSRTSRPTITLTGTAAGADTVIVTREGQVLGRSGGPTFTLVPTLRLGSNPLLLVAADRAGNRSTPAGPYVVTYEEAIGFHAPERFRANDVFELNLPSPGRGVRIDLYTLDGRRVRTLTASQSSANYELPWNLLDDSGREVGDGPYVARLTVTFADGTSQQQAGAVVVTR
jgi:flagellar hook assembly protein FlgD